MAYNELTPTSELEAVNECLAVIGESPVDDLDADTVADAETARNVIRSVSRRVQARGLHSNSERSYRIGPNQTGEVILPANTLKVDGIKTNREHDLVVRGRRLYDRLNHTYEIGEAVLLDIVTMLPFEDLPEPTRAYITIRAARIFHDRILGDEATHAYTKQDELEAKADFVKAEIQTRDANMLKNRHSARILNRRTLLR